MVAPHPQRMAVTDPVASLAGIRVLIVDDEDDAREILSRSAAEFGAEVTSMPSGAAALAHVRACTIASLPHIIATDIGMPEKDGYGFLCELRKLPRQQGGDVPVIAVTAYAGPVERDRALAAGFKLYLEKPVSPLALAAAIARVTAGAG